ncbi:MFS transporter [Corynebacterium sp. p3-SID1194]|uniref:MFS transporter n=1 Tax=Corynebacterium sp. p3-SID1194 TaxID=2916105 RepID=UPI0021A96725|nr:MFS transporter [Corynebacterium sp. p3-SID1194]MCT1450161.1 MFS transporter [Corynebacterium sp. p3-SID1194]
MNAQKSRPQLVFASVVAFLITAGWSANHFASVLVVLREKQDMSTLLVNSAYGIYAVGLFPCLIAGGLVADRFGSRPAVMVGAVVAALGNVALMFWQEVPAVLLGARFVIGLGVGLVVSAGTAWAGRLRGAAGTTLAGIFLTSGFMLGPIASGIIAHLVSAHNAIYIPYIASILLSFAAVAFSAVVGDAPNTREVVVEKKEDEQGVRAPAHERSAKKALATAFPMGLWVFASMTSAIVVLSGRVGQHFESSAFLPGVAAVVAFGSGFAIQALGRRFAFGPSSGVVGAVCSAVGMSVAAVGGAAPSVAMFVVASMFLGLAYGLCLREGLLDVETFSPPEKRGAVIGIYYVATYIGFGYPPLIEWLAGYVGPSLPYWVLAALALCSAVIRTVQIRSGYLRRG